jgi:biotin operon repressor
MTASELALVMSRHMGRECGISCKALAEQCGVPERHIRKLVSELRFEGTAIVGKPDTGYYVATEPHDIDDFVNFHFARARHSLAMVSRVRRVSMPELLGQLQLVEGRSV